MDVVKLNGIDKKLANFIGTQRTESNRSNSVTNQKISYFDDKKIDVNGACGEVAFAKWANLYPDTEIKPQNHTYDFVLRDGRTIDVKTTEYVTGKLVATEDKTQNDCDIYVLVIGDITHGSYFKIVGWMHSHKLIQDRRLGRLREDAPLSYIATQDELNPMDTLILAL